MDQELRAYLDDLKSSMEERFGSMEERFRHTEILIEGVRHEVRLVAEGVDAANEKLAAFQADTARRFEEVQSSFTPSPGPSGALGAGVRESRRSALRGRTE